MKRKGLMRALGDFSVPSRAFIRPLLACVTNISASWCRAGANSFGFMLCGWQ